MMFDEAVEIILKHEGGYVNHDKDPGGETNFGICKRAYPHLKIKDITRQAAIQIYKRDYWDACHVESLPPKARLMVFDCAVNQGASTARKFTQSAMCVGVEEFIGKFAMLRLKRYTDNPNFKTFGAGWVKRLFEVTIVCFSRSA